MDQKKPEDNIPFLPISMCIGISIGTAIGVSVGNLSVGMCIGLSIGVGVGLFLDGRSRKKQQEEPSPSDAPEAAEGSHESANDRSL